MTILRIFEQRFKMLVVWLIVASFLAGAAAAQEPPRVDVLVGFHAPPGPADEALVRRAGGRISHTFDLVPVIAANLPQAAMNALQNNPRVQYVELDGPMFAIGQQVPWGIDRVFDNDEGERLETWANSFLGWGTGVAVLDTGIDQGHEDLIVADGVVTIGGGHWGNDANGHGTHVAGTIAALDNDVGVVGVAPAAELYAVKVLRNNGSGTVSSVVAGIQWAVDGEIPVLNMSLGGGHSQTLENACNVAYAAGHLLVAAAGNSGNAGGTGNNVIFPAGYDSVIAVAASDINDQRAWFSSTGPAVELIAPGVGILSTLPGNSYGSASGTSMASPHVAGAAALVWATSPDLSNADVREILELSAEDLGLSPNHQGSGLVRADTAVALATLPTATSSIKGTVTDTDIDSPVPITGATVSVDGFDISAITDDYGDYEFENVPVGEHVVTASAEGYHSSSLTVVVEEDEPVELNFALEPIVTHRVSGTVTNLDEDPHPLEGVLVILEGPGFYSAVTASDGRYEILNVEEGFYEVTASKEGYSSESIFIDVVKDSEFDFALEELAPIPDEPQVSVTNITYGTHGGRNNDRHLTVTIFVEDDFENAVEGASVLFVLQNDTGGNWQATRTTDNDGIATFSVNNAPDGIYTTEIVDVDADGLEWDGETPENEFEK